MNDIDWSKAPEGTTHYVRELYESLEAWAKFSDGYWYYSYSKGHNWTSWSPSKSVTNTFVERPKEWDGKGLPPVGTVCEALWNESGAEWLRVKVFGVNEHGQPIHRWEEGPKIYEYQASPLRGIFGPAYFRPIKTAEQIATGEREVAISKMEEILSGYSYKNCAKALYDAGYRKQEVSK